MVGGVIGDKVGKKDNLSGSSQEASPLRTALPPLFVIKSRNKLITICVRSLMKGYIGEFEELVLLTIALLDEQAYGVSIKEEIEKRASRNISIGALHSTIARLEEKGFLRSHLSGSTHERGGQEKTFF